MSPSERRILLVDDEPIVRQSLQQWLEMEGYTVESASGGEEALQICRATAIAIGVFDIRMPGMDGITLLRTVRRTYPDLAVIMMTAYASLDDAVTCIQQGAYDYIIKPFPPEKLTHQIRHLFDRATKQEEIDRLRRQCETYRQFIEKYSSMILSMPVRSEAPADWADFLQEWRSLHLPVPANR